MSRASSSLRVVHELEGTHQEVGAEAGSGRRPLGRLRLPRLHGRLGVSRVGVRDRREHGAGRRVADLEPSPARGGAPVASHEQLGGHIDRVDDRAEGRVHDGHRASAVAMRLGADDAVRASRRAARSPAWAARTMCSRASTSRGLGLFATSRLGSQRLLGGPAQLVVRQPELGEGGGDPDRRQQRGDPVDRLVGEVLGRRVPGCAHRQRDGGKLRDPGGPVELHDVGQQGADPDPVRGVGDRADRVLDRVGRGRAGGAEGEPARGGAEHHRLAGLPCRPGTTRRAAGCRRSAGPPGGRRCR